MAEAWKNQLNHKTVSELAESIKSVYSVFAVSEFMETTMEDWESLELMARGRRVTENMRAYLPHDYKEALSIMDKVIPVCDDFLKLCFPTFVELYGLEDENIDKNWDVSMAALELYTQYSSSEFAVRPFIINHEERMMAQMYEWSKHDNEHVRRLSSEGCRPALPWGQALVKYKKDPSPILQILEQLKTDSSLYVRKSVANNINDISKTHPDLIAKLSKDWYGKHKNTDWIIKHGCRTLLKKGNRDVLQIFGFGDSDAVLTSGFALSADLISIGEEITFSFEIQAKSDTKVRLEYGVDFMKANGKQSRKIFQISEIAMKAGEKKSYTKKQDFKDLSTRKHYAGKHAITLIVNGAERGTIDFEIQGDGDS
ncbi:MAG: DNA alkylation repair protein [Oscillospiraceae bacterium]|nr:DNA alkylation repair protein [Oscillospiraceae bacterium]